MFTEEAFRVLLRNRFSGPVSQTPDRAGADPVVGALDASPDPATAWVYGLYFCVLERLPSRLELVSAADECRAGRPPQDLWQALQSPGETPTPEGGRGERSGAGDQPHQPDQPDQGDQPDPPDESEQLGNVYVTGCYLSVLGRRPDASGLQFHQALQRSTGSDQAVLDSLMASDEYKLQVRFPPPAARLDLAVGEALQTIVLGDPPEDSLTGGRAAMGMASQPPHLGDGRADPGTDRRRRPGRPPGSPARRSPMRRNRQTNRR